MSNDIPSGVPVNLCDTQQGVLGYEYLMKNESLVSRSKYDFPFV
jgi:hypothetical protein